ncbi:hypothetical protein V6N13_099703 [Hibiscus sabdariffa]
MTTDEMRVKLELHSGKLRVLSKKRKLIEKNEESRAIEDNKKALSNKTVNDVVAMMEGWSKSTSESEMVIEPRPDSLSMLDLITMASNYRLIRLVQAS